MQRDVTPASAGIEHPHADFRQTQRLNLAEHVVKSNPSGNVNLPIKRYAWRRIRDGSPAAFSIPNRGAANELN